MEERPLCSVVLPVPFFYRDGVVDILRLLLAELVVSIISAFGIAERRPLCSVVLSIPFCCRD